MRVFFSFYRNAAGPYRGRSINVSACGILCRPRRYIIIIGKRIWTRLARVYFCVRLSACARARVWGLWTRREKPYGTRVIQGVRRWFRRIFPRNKEERIRPIGFWNRHAVRKNPKPLTGPNHHMTCPLLPPPPSDPWLEISHTIAKIAIGHRRFSRPIRQVNT